MADPGTLIPADAAGAHMHYDESYLSTYPVSIGPSRFASSSGGTTSSSEDSSEFSTIEQRSKLMENIAMKKESMDKEEHLSSSAAIELPKQYTDGLKTPWDRKREPALEVSSRPNHTRSPSWTEGVSNPAVRKMKVKDVSKYMMKAAKENPQLAQKLHDVLLESGVVAPPNLFTEMYPEQLEMPLTDVKPPLEEKEKKSCTDKLKKKGINNLDRSFLPPLPHQGFHHKEVIERASSDSEASPVKYKQSVPVAAAAAAAAAVVASSMVVAAAKTNCGPKIQLPVAAAATATAAAVVATTAAVTKQIEVLGSSAHLPDIDRPGGLLSLARNDVDTDVVIYERGSGEGLGASSEGETFEGLLVFRFWCALVIFSFSFLIILILFV